MKACNGIYIPPVKGSHLVSVQADKPAERHISRYAPPSKRKEEVKTLTKEDIDSDTLFPTLSPMKPMTSGASWSQIRNRLSRPSNQFEALDEDSPMETPIMSPKTPGSTKSDMSFLHVIDERLRREKAELEEGIRRDTITQPSQMTMEQRSINGWSTLPLPPNYIEINEHFNLNNVFFDENYYNAGNVWDTLWSPGEPVECVHLGGAPIERTEKRVDHFAEFAKNQDSTVNYTPISESSVTAAKNKMFAFFGMGPLASAKVKNTL